MLSPLTTSFIRAGGVPLRVGLALPAAGSRTAVMIAPGRGEFIEKYDRLVSELTDRGLGVGIVEWRGQGRSHRALANSRKGHVRSFEEYLHDLRDALTFLEGAGLPRRRVLLGHSMGGHIAFRFLARPGHGFTAAALTAPMMGINLRGFSPMTASVLAHAAVLLGLGGRYALGQRDLDPALARFDGNPLTGCIEHYTRFYDLVAAQAELGLGGVTWGWLAAALRSMAAAAHPGVAEAIDVPTLVCRSGGERIVDNAAIGAISARLRHGRLVDFPDARHEVMMELPPIRDRFMGLLDELLAEAGEDEALRRRPAARSRHPALPRTSPA